MVQEQILVEHQEKLELYPLIETHFEQLLEQIRLKSTIAYTSNTMMF